MPLWKRNKRETPTISEGLYGLIVEGNEKAKNSNGRVFIFIKLVGYNKTIAKNEKKKQINWFQRTLSKWKAIETIEVVDVFVVLIAE